MASYIYARVSTVQQENGLSLDAQVQACSAYWEQLKATGTFSRDDVLSVVREQCSGSVAFTKREKGGELFRKLKSGDVLIGAKLDRLWRSAKDALNMLDEFKKRGVAVHLLDIPGGSITGNGVSELLFTLLSAVGQWERSRISERTREAKREAARQGYYIGGRVQWEKMLVRGKLVDDPKKAIVVRKIRKWRDEGVPLRTIVARVEEHGFTISTDAVRRLTANVPNAVRTRGRRKHRSNDDEQTDSGDRDGRPGDVFQSQRLQRVSMARSRNLPKSA